MYRLEADVGGSLLSSCVQRRNTKKKLDILRAKEQTPQGTPNNNTIPFTSILFPSCLVLGGYKDGGKTPPSSQAWLYLTICDYADTLTRKAALHLQSNSYSKTNYMHYKDSVTTQQRQMWWMTRRALETPGQLT